MSATTKVAQAYVTMLTHRDKFGISIEQQGVLCNLRDALVELMERHDLSAQEVQDDAEQIAFDNRVQAGTDKGLIPMTPERKDALRKQANEARLRFGMVVFIPDRPVRSWRETGISNAL